MSLPFQFIENPPEEERLAILSPLVEHNQLVGPSPDLGTFAFLIKDSDQKTIGGLWGRTAYNWAFIELLFVPESMRGTGIGTQLVQAAEQVATKRNCVGIWLDSFGFQAPQFYMNLNYEIFGKLPEYPKGHSRYFLRKILVT